MFKKLLCISIFFLIGNYGFSQMLETQVVSTSGGSFSNSAGQISWSIGEPFIETLSSRENDVSLLQGLHQPFFIINGISDLNHDNSISVFPNPTSRSITVKFKNIEEDILVEIFTPDGKPLLKHSIHQLTEDKLNLSSYPSGVYFLFIKKNFQVIQSYKIIKQ